MGKVYETITDDLRVWIERQKMFVVSTASLSGDGLINCSPKGLDSFRILGPKEIGYLDLTGSGVETIAHLKENGRIVIMLCAFEGPPKIVRLHGIGTPHFIGSPEFERLQESFPQLPGTRSIIHVQVTRVSDSCGYGVPCYEHTGNRDTLVRLAETRGEEAMEAYRCEKNMQSLDGLPGWTPLHESK